MQLLWKSVQKFFEKLEIEHPDGAYSLKIPFPTTDICSSVFVATPFYAQQLELMAG